MLSSSTVPTTSTLCWAVQSSPPRSWSLESLCRSPLTCGVWEWWLTCCWAVPPLSWMRAQRRLAWTSAGWTSASPGIISRASARRQETSSVCSWGPTQARDLWLGFASRSHGCRSVWLMAEPERRAAWIRLASSPSSTGGNIRLMLAQWEESGASSKVAFRPKFNRSDSQLQPKPRFLRPKADHKQDILPVASSCARSVGTESSCGVEHLAGLDEKNECWSHPLSQNAD